MDTGLDFTTIQTILESNAEKVENLIESYIDKKEQLISLLQDVQAEFNYIPQDVLVRISQKLEIPLSQVFSVATFFQAFSLCQCTWIPIQRPSLPRGGSALIFFLQEV